MLERTYIIPLRKEWLKAQRYKRAKKAVSAVKKFLARHMKSEDVRILPELNVELWAHGIRNPPCRIKVTTIKTDKGIVYGQLFGKKIELAEEKKEKKKKEKKEAEEKAAEKKTAKEEKEAEKPEEKPAKEETQKAKSPEETATENETAKTSAKPVKKEKTPAKKTVKKAVKEETAK